MALPNPNSMLPSTAETKRRPVIPPREQGYILIAVLFMTFMVLLTLSIAAPKVAADLERDREVELMHRGKQYQRAIQLYYRKFGAYPPNMDALVKTQEIRFLRKQYVDPATGKKEWHLIHFGEAKTPTLGFFGQPLAGTGGAGSSIMSGVGPSGGNANAGTPMGGAPGASSAAGPGGMGSGGGFGSDSGGGFSLGATPSSSPTGAASATGSSTDPNASGASGSNSLGSNTASNFGGSQQTFGGAGIIGVESGSPKETILEYKKKKHFNEWEFVYDPLSEQLTANNGAAAGPSMGGAGNSATTFGGSSPQGGAGSSAFGGSSSGGFGSSSPGGFGGSSSGGFGGSSSPAPASPSQPQ